MYVCESWTIKKVDLWRIDAFEPWCWRRHLRVPQTARRSKQSILKDINPEYWLKRLVLKLKLQYFGHLIWKANSLEKDSDAGKDWRQKEMGATKDEMVRWHHQLTDLNLSKYQETMKDKEGWHAVVHGVAKLDTTWWLNNCND